MKKRTENIIRVAMITPWNTRCGIAGNTGFFTDAVSSDIKFEIWPPATDEIVNDDDRVMGRVWTPKGDPRRLIEAVAGSRPDVIHVQHSVEFHFASTLAELVRRTKRFANTIITCHNTLFLYPDNKRQLRNLNKAVFVVHNDGDKQQLCSYGIKESRILLIPLGQIPAGDMDVESARRKMGILAGSGAGGAAGSTEEGAAGSLEEGAAGSTEGGAAGSTEGGAAGSTEGGAAGSTEGGAAGSTEGGAAGSLKEGAAGSTEEDAAGSLMGTARRFPVIGSYGFLMPHKGIGNIIRALSILKERYPDVFFISCNALYGNDASQGVLDECKGLIAELGLRKHVMMIPDYLEPPKSLGYLQACDLCILPYGDTVEGASGAVRSCVAAGRPLILTKQAIFDEYRDCAFFIDDNSPEAIACGVERLMERETYDKYSEAVKAAAGRNSWPEVAARYEALYRGN